MLLTSRPTGEPYDGSASRFTQRAAGDLVGEEDLAAFGPRLRTDRRPGLLVPAPYRGGALSRGPLVGSLQSRAPSLDGMCPRRAPPAAPLPVPLRPTSDARPPDGPSAGRAAHPGLRPSIPRTPLRRSHVPSPPARPPSEGAERPAPTVTGARPPPDHSHPAQRPGITSVSHQWTVRSTWSTLFPHAGARGPHADPQRVRLGPRWHGPGEDGGPVSAAGARGPGHRRRGRRRPRV
ncbi:hypothetical protein EDD95_4643 [Streptomyces sp. CEV 2-1]|nr:hypothetical protein EDD95_4643 [Streptomyces sp. CEV 2-1]